jgi:hypothetical protein
MRSDNHLNKKNKGFKRNSKKKKMIIISHLLALGAYYGCCHMGYGLNDKIDKIDYVETPKEIKVWHRCQGYNLKDYENIANLGLMTLSQKQNKFDGAKRYHHRID